MQYKKKESSVAEGSFGIDSWFMILLRQDGKLKSLDIIGHGKGLARNCIKDFRSDPLELYIGKIDLLKFNIMVR